MNKDTCVLYFKQKFIRYGFLISLILLTSSLSLADNGDRTVHLTCPMQLTDAVSGSHSYSVVIHASNQLFQEKYYPQIENLYRNLEYLSINRALNGYTKFMVSLALITADGQLDLLRSHLTIRMIGLFSYRVDDHVFSRNEIKYSLYDVFRDKLEREFFGRRELRFQVVRKMRLAIIAAFPETFLDFVKGDAVDFTHDNRRILGLETNEQRRRVINKIIEELDNVAREIDQEQEVRKHERIRRIMELVEGDNDINEISASVSGQDLELLRRIDGSLPKSSDGGDHFRDSVLKGRLIQIIKELRTPGLNPFRYL